MSNFLGKAFTSMNQILNDAASLKQSIAPEIAEAGAIASSYYYANVNAGIKIDDKNKFIAKQKNQILNGGPLAKQNAEKATKFLNEQTAKQTSYNLKKKEYDQFVEFYDRKVEEYLKTSLMKYSDRVKFLERASDMRKAPAILKSIGANKDSEYKKFESFSQDNIISKIEILNLMKSEENNAKINLKSYKTSSNPMLVVDGWNEQKSKQTSYGVAKAVNSFGEPIVSNTESIGNKAKLNKSEQVVLSQKSSTAPVTATTMAIDDIIKDSINSGYTMIPTPKGSNASVFNSGDKVRATVLIDNNLYVLNGDKNTGKYNVSVVFENGDSTTVNDQNQINDIFGPSLDAVNERLAAGVSTDEAVKIEETAKAEEAGTKMPTPETTTTTTEDTITTSESPETATESAPANKTTNYSNQTGYASGQAKSSPTAKAFYRVKNPTGGPDKLYDAVTNKLIADEAEFKTGYTKEIEMPKTVKAIYRVGSKIYDYHTGKHITDPSILGSQYKGAIEVAKKKTDDDYFNEMKAEIGGKRADGQPGYNDEQIKEISQMYKNGKYKTAREAYADILSKQGKIEIETEERAKRKFSKILKNDDGTIKVDENGRPMKEDFFFPIYTSEELEKLSDEERARIEKEAKEAYLAKGGKEENWLSSQEKIALDDTLNPSNPASKDEMARAADLKARDNMEKAKNSGKETTYRNPYGKSDYNVSEDTLVGSEDKKEETILPTKGEDPTDPSGTTGGSTTNAGTAINPWAANAKKPKEKELAKFQYTSLEKKATSYKKFDNKNKLAGTE